MQQKLFRKQFFLLSVLTLISIQLIAQKESKSMDYSSYPYWIEMINNPNVNYFEALKAYDAFWSNHIKPLEEDEKIGQDKNAANKERTNKWFKSKEEKEIEESKKYLLDVKKFEHWKLTVKPYVQEDGRILSAEEQLKLWENQKK